MKNIFYCTKQDKNGNKLTSSYTSKKGADKYGVGCEIEETIFRADTSNPKTLRMRDANFKGPLLRGLLVNSKPPATTEKGQFVVWGKVNDEWSETVFHFPTYSAANTAMKSMISEYQAMAILDMEETVSKVEDSIDTSVSMDTEV